MGWMNYCPKVLSWFMGRDARYVSRLWKPSILQLRLRFALGQFLFPMVTCFAFPALKWICYARKHRVQTFVWFIHRSRRLELRRKIPSEKSYFLPLALKLPRRPML